MTIRYALYSRPRLTADLTPSNHFASAVRRTVWLVENDVCQSLHAGGSEKSSLAERCYEVPPNVLHNEASNIQCVAVTVRVPLKLAYHPSCKRRGSLRDTSLLLRQFTSLSLNVIFSFF